MAGLSQWLAGFATTGLAVVWVSGMPAAAHPGGMVTGAYTTQPIGHIDFCRRHPSECAIRPVDQSAHVLSDALLTTLKDITVAINKAVRPASDKELHDTNEFWSYPDGAGDCEDYALAKQRALAERGISRANLLITVVRKKDGEGHAILTVRTDGGDFILDNLNDDVLAWTESDYTFLKRQATTHSGRWVTILHDRKDQLVGSIR